MAEATTCLADFSTDTTASVADILGIAAARFSFEITFCEREQVIEAGQQHMRIGWANHELFHFGLWESTMTEVLAWGRKEKLVAPSASPRDKSLRCASHAKRRQAWRRRLLAEGIRATVRPGAPDPQIQAIAERLLRLAEWHE